MGLDMYVFATDADIPPVDFKMPDESERLHYWRKHYDLHEWMERLYRTRGGQDEEFNCVQLRLDEADLDALEGMRSAPLADNGLDTLTERERQADLGFIHKARDALAQGLRVYYTSWW